VNIAALLPYKGFAAIQQERSVVNSQYNSLQVAWNRRFNHDYSINFAYTSSKSMDNGSKLPGYRSG
jgi:hypothetical protein